MNLAVLDLATAPPQTRETLADVKKKYGFLPNLYGIFAHSPAPLAAYLGISAAFDQSSFTPLERNIVLLTTSRANDCRYCVAVHSAVGDMQKHPADVIDAIRNDTPIPGIGPVQPVFKRVRLEQARQRHRDHAGLVGRQMRHHRLEALRQDDADAVAGLRAEPGEAVGEPVRVNTQTTIAYRFAIPVGVPAPERDTVGLPRRPVVAAGDADIEPVGHLPIEIADNVVVGHAGKAHRWEHPETWPAKCRRSWRLVPLAGIEPALLAELDFESSASTNSATGACAGVRRAGGL